MKTANFRRELMPKHLWTKCDTCAGTGYIEEKRDLHRCGGFSPCVRCDNGTVKHRVIISHVPNL